MDIDRRTQTDGYRQKDTDRRTQTEGHRQNDIDRRIQTEGHRRIQTEGYRQKDIDPLRAGFRLRAFNPREKGCTCTPVLNQNHECGRQTENSNIPLGKDVMTNQLVCSYLTELKYFYFENCDFADDRIFQPIINVTYSI